MFVSSCLVCLHNKRSGRHLLGEPLLRPFLQVSLLFLGRKRPLELCLGGNAKASDAMVDVVDPKISKDIGRTSAGRGRMRASPDKCDQNLHRERERERCFVSFVLTIITPAQIHSSLSLN